jgi:outer membrane protein assembly factor BamA
VIERKVRFVGAGVGYGTRDQLRLSGEWGHRNFLGRGKRASVEAILATELFPVDLVRRRLEGRYVEPWLFNTRTTGTAELFYEHSRQQYSELRDGVLVSGAYDLTLVGLVVNVNRRLARNTRGWLALENTWADVDADPGTTPPDSLRPDLTRTLSTILERDRRDDFFEPHHGFLNRVIGSISGGPLGGDNDFWKTQIEMSWFRPAFHTILAGRVRVGYERPYGDTEFIPDRERFKLGGATTVRGYEYQEIGSGDFLILLNFENRFPLFWIFDGGVFIDGGNAWETPGEVRWKDFRLSDAKDDPGRASETDFRYGVGAGLRAETPVGPVRLDYGYKLKTLPPADNQSEETRWRFHLSLGHVF